jgi:hypothetical protein
LVAALRPSSWRIGGPYVHAIHLAQRTAGSTSLILEGDWQSCPRIACGDVTKPWEELGRFAKFVRQDVRRRVADGSAPTYWDVWNEPGRRGTPREWFRTFDVAYHAIRRADPHAGVVGPSIGAFAVHHSFDGPALAPFLKYAAAHHDRFDAVSYHDEANSGGAPLFSPHGLRTHAAKLRNMIHRYPSLRGAKIFVNEYGPIPAMREPGWIVGDAATLEHSDVSQANYTCPSLKGCTSRLDDLLTPSGEPRIPYWVFLAYRQLHGRNLKSKSPASNISATAARSSDGTTRILIGRHDDCGAPPRPWLHAKMPDVTCAANLGYTTPAVTVPLHISTPGWAQHARVSVRYFPTKSSHIGLSAKPIAQPRRHEWRIVIRHGAAHVDRLRLHDGDAYEVILRPQRRQR